MEKEETQVFIPITKQEYVSDIPLDSMTQRFLEGGRIDVNNETVYDGTYCSGGYPAEGIGVCTDVIWRAFKHCGISLKDSVDSEIQKKPIQLLSTKG